MAKNLDKRIDELTEARSSADLAARLQPILREMAYYIAMGEGVVLEAHEEWHTDFTDSLYEAARVDRSAAQAAAQAAARPSFPQGEAHYQPAPRQPMSRRPGAAGAPAPRGAGGARPELGHGSGVRENEQQLVQPQRGPQRGPLRGPQRGSELSPILRSIMDGTHASFSDH